MSGRSWKPLGEPDESRAAATRGLAAAISILEPGQFFVLESAPIANWPDEQVWLAVANYGHNFLMVEVAGNTALSSVTQLAVEEHELMRESGFTPPTGCDELVGSGETWQWPFGQQDVVAAAEIVVWVHEVIFQLPHPIMFADVRGGSFLHNGNQPCLHDLEMHCVSGLRHP
jgi:hypothetical protein